MPLIHSKSPAALKSNMRVLMGEISRSPHVQSRKQAIAIGLETQRRARKDFGGAMRPPAAPWFVRSEARNMGHFNGFIPGVTGGRADAVPGTVRGGSYIV